MNKSILILTSLFLSFIIHAQKADELIGKYHMPNKLDI